MKKLLGVVISLIFINSSYSADPVYIDANLGVNTSYSGAIALGLNGGYLLNNYLGIEGGATLTAAANPNSMSNGGNYYLFDAAIKGILPLGSVFSLYGKLGLGYSLYDNCVGCTSSPSTSSNLGLYYGAGAGFNLSNNWSLHLEDYAVTGNNPNMLMFGTEYHF